MPETRILKDGSVMVDSPTLTVPLAVRDALGLGVAPGEPPTLAAGFRALPDLAGLRARVGDGQEPALRARWAAWWRACLELLGIDQAAFPTADAWRAATREHRASSSGQAPDFDALADAPVLREAAQAAAALNAWPLWPSPGQQRFGNEVITRMLAMMDRSDPRWWEDGLISVYVLDVTGHYVQQFGPQVILIDRRTAGNDTAMREMLAAALGGRAGLPG